MIGEELIIQIGEACSIPDETRSVSPENVFSTGKGRAVKLPTVGVGDGPCPCGSDPGSSQCFNDVCLGTRVCEGNQALVLPMYLCFRVPKSGRRRKFAE